MVRRPALSSSSGVASTSGTTKTTTTTTTSSGQSAPEAGIIKSVYVENFMCHHKLTVDLCRNVNFIHGQNGSGKSAILAAIQICLGAGARRTHRARNLKDLVRKDASASVTHAKVRVTLWNQGTDAYRHDVYGDQVTVERIISLRTGGYNGYKLLDHKGVERSRSKKDLEDLLDQLNIQIENPVAVLDQEDAKKFLTGKPQDKYSFFMKATELERMDRQYASISDKLLEMSETKVKVEASLTDLADRVKKLKKQWDQHQEVEKLEQKLLELNMLFSWAFYHDFDQQHEQMQETMAQIEAKLEKNNLQLSQVEASQDLTSEEDVLKQKVDVLTEEAQQQAQAKRDLEAQVKLAMAPCKQLEREHHQITQRDIPTAERQFQQAQHRLHEARERIKEMAGSAESKEAQRTAALQQTEQDYQAAKEKHSQIKQAVTNALRAYEELEPQVEQARQSVHQVQNRIKSVECKIDELNSSSGTNSLAVFGSKCTAMRRMVDGARKEGKFRGPVVGPIGAHIKVAPGKENLALIAEFALGNGTLDRFVVTNDQDRKVFMDLRKAAGCGPSECNCFQVPLHDRYKVPPPPSNDVQTVASTLTIDDDLVFNCLVDSVRIDQKALAASKEVSEQSLLQVQSDGRESIKAQNVKEVYFLPHGDCWSVRKGSRTIISNERRLRQNIGVDRSAVVQEMQQELAVHKAELAELRQKENQVEAEHTKHQREWNRLKHTEGVIRKEIQTLAAKIDQLKSEADMATNINIDTSDQEEEVEAAERNLQQLQDHAARVMEDIESKTPEVNQLRAKLTDVTKRNEKVLEDLKVAEEQLGSFMQSLSQREKLIEKRREKVQKLKAIVDDHRRKMQSVSDHRDQALHHARVLTFQLQRSKSQKERETLDEDDEKMGVQPTDEELEEIEPVPTDKDTKTYEAKIRRTEKQIQKERENRKVSNEDPVVAYQKFMRANVELQKKLTELDIISRNESKLQKDLQQRQEMWKDFRAHLVIMTNSRFDEILQLKGSAGELDFDHEEGTLNLIVQKDNKDSSSQTNDVKALSGGERSFTTLSLLLALGESLETPFRVMDEFDVFLDPVARKIALDTLVEIGKKMDHRQFIFITPQDLSSLTPDDKLRIKKLKAPERSNVAGGPEQQTLNFSSQAGA